MRAKILSIMLLMSLSAILMAQTTENGPKKPMRGQDHSFMMQRNQRGPVNGLNLTDAQKESFKQSMMVMHKQLQPIRNELGEAEAHQKTLVSNEKPDLAAINKNIERIGALRVEMAKIQTKHHLEMRAQLTDEQRLKFDMFKRKRMEDNGKKKPMGMKYNRGMQQERPMM
jgi:Spy/CpxP family protein refolding chaperone